MRSQIVKLVFLFFTIIITFTIPRLAIGQLSDFNSIETLANELNFEEPQLYAIRSLAAYGINAQRIGPKIVELTHIPIGKPVSPQLERLAILDTKKLLEI